MISLDWLKSRLFSPLPRSVLSILTSGRCCEREREEGEGEGEEEGGEGDRPLDGRGRFTPDPSRGVDGDVRTSPGPASSGRGWDGSTSVVIGGGIGKCENPRLAGLGGTKGAGRCVGQGP